MLEMCVPWLAVFGYVCMFRVVTGGGWVGGCCVEEVSFHIKDAWSHENHDTCNYFVLMESCLIECCV